MKSQDDILLEQAYSKILEEESNNIPYNDKEEMVKKISGILPTLDVEDLQYLHDHLFGEDEEDSENTEDDSTDEYGFTNKMSRDEQLRTKLGSYEGVTDEMEKKAEEAVKLRKRLSDQGLQGF